MTTQKQKRKTDIVWRRDNNLMKIGSPVCVCLNVKENKNGKEKRMQQEQIFHFLSFF